MSGKVVKVNNQNVAIKDFNGQRVVTFKDIDTVHERADGTARKRFNDNKNHFVEGEDFFVLTQPSEIRTLGIERPQGGVPEKVTLVTESGYLMLVKSFTDDLAWNVQRQLVKSYFKAVQQNETKRKVQSGRLSLSSASIMVKNVIGSLECAKIEPAYIAAEVKRLYSTLGYEIMTAAAILPTVAAMHLFSYRFLTPWLIRNLQHPGKGKAIQVYESPCQFSFVRHQVFVKRHFNILPNQSEVILINIFSNFYSFLFRFRQCSFHS